MTSADRISVSCTLPTADRPVRPAEFDDLLATALRDQQRPEPTVLRWRLDRSAEAKARELAGRESACCSFFSFSFVPDATGVLVEVRVPASHAAVLDALAARAAVRAGTACTRPRRSPCSG